MNKKRIIPCLDLKDGRVVKGVNFVNLVDAGNPVEIAKAYEKEGADELILLDISSTSKNRDKTLFVIEKIVKTINIPITVGGGIKNVEDIQKILNQGAQKVSIGSSAFENPDFITQASQIFGSDKIVIGIDAKYNKSTNSFQVFINGGRTNTNVDAIDWAKEVDKRGAGEILLTSMDKDGVKSGYDIKLTKAITESVTIPVIASGGAGKKEDFLEVLTDGKADAALAASLFHFNELKIKDLKKYLLDNNIQCEVD